jgi:hypothetical protein
MVPDLVFEGTAIDHFFTRVKFGFLSVAAIWCVLLWFQVSLSLNSLRLSLPTQRRFVIPDKRSADPEPMPVAVETGCPVQTSTLSGCRNRRELESVPDLHTAVDGMDPGSAAPSGMTKGWGFGRLIGDSGGWWK